ncbi:MAG: hypothetical protein CTY37_05375 [Methylotenera sp.]|nr:MAG: hypothetical protein CTY37_05375 [Methylotenera sp.]PPD18184.1 MAG: hypothetical protein CTY27_02250 [Methylotenera sp.]
MHLNVHYLTPALSLLALFGNLVATPLYAGGKNVVALDDQALLEQIDESGLEKTLEYNFSPDDRARLRKALADYARSTDPEHAQIEQKRKAMKESVQARFNECNKDNDDSIDREEATLCLPQIARHFNFVDVDENNVITLEELELAQAKSIERQKAAEAKMEAQKILDTEAEIKNKTRSKINKEASNPRKRPS